MVGRGTSVSSDRSDWIFGEGHGWGHHQANRIGCFRSGTAAALDHAKPKPAVEHFRKAAAKAPEQTPWRADLYFQLAQAESLTGAKAAALTDFKKFLDIAPPDTPSRHEAKQQVARIGGGKMQLGGTNQ
jgi:tetratricopeptide (TPR) repeat protein